MTENIVLETGVTIDNQAFRVLLGRTGISGYVENGLDFDPNWSGGVLNVSPGKVFLLDAHRDYPLLADATIDVPFSQGTVSDVYAIYNEDSAPDERADVVAIAGSDGPPTNPSLLIGTVDDTDQSFVELNRDTPVASPLEDGDNDGYLEIPNHQGIENDHDALVNIRSGQHHDRPEAGDGLDEDGNGRFNVDENEINLPDPHDRPQAGDGIDEDGNGRFNVDESEIDFPPGGVYVNAAEFPGSTGGVKIQNALDSLPSAGGTVYVPNDGPDGGNWNCGPTGGIQIPSSNITLLSAGAKLFLPAGTADTAIIETNDYLNHAYTGENGTTKNGIVIEGFDLNGNGGGSGTNMPCIAILNADDAAVRDCHAHDLGYGVNVKQSKGVLVENCLVSGAGDDGISVSESHTGEDHIARNEGNVVHACRVIGCEDNAIEVDDGSAFTLISDCHAEGNGGTGFEAHSHNLKPAQQGAVPAAGPTNHLLVTNCSAVENDGDGFRVARNSAGDGFGYLFSNITAIRNGEHCFTMDDTPQGGDRGQRLQRLYLTNFHFRQGEGASASAVKLFQDASPIRSVGITNGMIYGPDNGGNNGIGLYENITDNLLISNVEIANCDFGIGVTQAANTKNLTIANCTIRDCDRTGIRVTGLGDHPGFTIANNTMENNGTTLSGNEDDAGIRLAGGNGNFDGGVIVGNTIRGTAHGMHIGSGNAPIDNFVVGLNNCWGCDSGLTSGRDDTAPPFGANSEVALNIFP